MHESEKSSSSHRKATEPEMAKHEKESATHKQGRITFIGPQDRGQPLKFSNLLEGKEKVIDLRNVTGAQPEKGEPHSETASGRKSSRTKATSSDINARKNSHVKARDSARPAGIQPKEEA